MRQPDARSLDLTVARLAAELVHQLDHLAERGRPVPAGFIHLPFLPSMVAAHDRDEPSMDLSTMIRAVEVVLPLLARA